MRNERGKYWSYAGSFIGFIGALLMALAMVTSEGGQVDPKKAQQLINAGAITIYPNQILEGHFVIMKHPYFNLIGIILICVGFFVQFFPVVLQFFTGSHEDGLNSK
ncbi:hypothetical protein AUJ46_03625 [Candidatus Peregrinibacteria bacterium CG1_02_54_53]|nr:MAG: hypothetical protein AUJ46_03625 [Candidatus Peregrinibacteria bacterium CG1_02_54_53]